MSHAILHSLISQHCAHWTHCCTHTHYRSEQETTYAVPETRTTQKSLVKDHLHSFLVASPSREALVYQEICAVVFPGTVLFYTWVGTGEAREDAAALLCCCFFFSVPWLPSSLIPSSVRNFALLSLLTCLGTSLGEEEGGRRGGGTCVVTPSTSPCSRQRCSCALGSAELLCAESQGSTNSVQYLHGGVWFRGQNTWMGNSLDFRQWVWKERYCSEGSIRQWPSSPTWCFWKAGFQLESSKIFADTALLWCGWAGPGSVFVVAHGAPGPFSPLPQEWERVCTSWHLLFTDSTLGHSWSYICTCRDLSPPQNISRILVKVADREMTKHFLTFKAD